MANKRIGLAERKSQEARRPVDALFGTVHDRNADVSDTESGTGGGGRQGKQRRTLLRQTYHMDPMVIEAIRIMEFETREGISTMVNRLLRNNIPEEVMRQAKASLEKRKGQDPDISF